MDYLAPRRRRPEDTLSMDAEMDQLLGLNSLPNLNAPPSPPSQSTRQVREMPELDPTLAQQIGRNVGGGLAAAGNILDIPGSMVRDVLSWKNPLDQLLTPTTDENRTTGRDMLRNLGAIGEDDTYGNFGAGLALEIALDPLTYVGIGPFTKAGTAAAKAGLTKGVTRTANQAASRRAAQAGKQVTREMKRGGAINRVSPRQLIDDAEDPAKALEDFVNAGGAEADLDKPLRALASFRVPGLMKEPAELLPKRSGQKAIDQFVVDNSIDAPAGSLQPETLKPLPQSKASKGFVNRWKSQVSDDLVTAVGDTMDSATNAIYKVPGVSELKAMFDYRVRGGTSEVGREVGRQTQEALQQAEYKFRELTLPIARAFEKSGLFDENVLVSKGMESEAAVKLLNDRDAEIRRFLENYDPKRGMQGTILSKDLQPLKPQLEAVRGLLDDILQVQQDAGLNISHLDDEYVAYLMRHLRKPGKQYRYNPTTGAVSETTSTAQKARKFRDYPGGISAPQEASIDPNISGLLNSARVVDGKLSQEQLINLREYAAEKYGDRVVPEFNLGEFDATTDRSLDSFINSMVSLPAEHAEQQIPMFGRSVIDDLNRTLEDGLRTSYTARQMQDLLAKTAAPTDITIESVRSAVRDAIQTGGDIDEAVKGVNQTHTVGSVLKELQLTTPRAYRNVIEAMPDEAKKLYQDDFANFESDVIAGLSNGDAVPVIKNGRSAKLKMSDGDLILESKQYQRGSKKLEKVEESIDLADLSGQLAETFDREFVERFGISPEVRTEATRWMKPFSQPDEVGNIRAALSRFMNVFRAGLTAPWPAFHMRNLISGQTQNAMMGAVDPTTKNPVMRIFKPLRQTYDLRLGKTVDGLAKEVPGFDKLTDEQATRQIADEIFTFGLVGDKQGISAEHIGQSHSAVRSQFPDLAGGRKYGVFNKAPAEANWFDRWVNPLAVRDGLTVGKEGVADVAEDLYAPAQYGRDIASAAEDFNRIAPYLSLRKQGFSPEAAADQVKKLQVDYSTLSAFERNTARQVIPFWTFSKKMLPVVLEELATNPGGPMGQTVRAINRARDSRDSIPEHIASTAAIPMGTKSDGSKSYLTGFGLAFEDSLNLANGLLRANPVEFAKDVAGRSSPFIKAPAEAIFGRSLYYDGPGGPKELRDLDPTLGRIRSNLYDIATGSNTEEPEPFIHDAVEFTAANSPFSRGLSTLRTLTDKRKWERPQDLFLNLGTGLRISDVSPNAQDAIYRGRLAEALKEMGGRTFSRSYISDAREERMTPEELAVADAILKELGVIDKRFKARRDSEQVAAR